MGGQNLEDVVTEEDQEKEKLGQKILLNDVIYN